MASDGWRAAADHDGRPGHKLPAVEAISALTRLLRRLSDNRRDQPNRERPGYGSNQQIKLGAHGRNCR